MPYYVALLRGINLGKRRIKMPELAKLFTEAGVTNVSTILASGNVIFATSRRSGAQIEISLATHLGEQLGYEVPTRIRSSAELEETIANAPFAELFTDEPHANTQVTFFDKPIPTDQKQALESLSTETDQLKVVGRELYWRCAIKISESPLWKNARANPHNLPNGTTRNLQTLGKIAARFPA